MQVIDTSHMYKYKKKRKYMYKLKTNPSQIQLFSSTWDFFSVWENTPQVVKQSSGTIPQVCMIPQMYIILQDMI